MPPTLRAMCQGRSTWKAKGDHANSLSSSVAATKGSVWWGACLQPPPDAKSVVFPSIHWKCSATATSLGMPQGPEVEPEGLSHDSLLYPAWALTPPAGTLFSCFVEYCPYMPYCKHLRDTLTDPVALILLLCQRSWRHLHKEHFWALYSKDYTGWCCRNLLK